MDENLIDDEDNNNKNDIRMTTGTKMIFQCSVL